MLVTFVFLLIASVVFVPIARRLGLGSILGYLVSGIVIGPSGLRLVTDVGSINEISELGVLMLLFLIGLELRPQRIWLMRKAVLGLGTAQVVVTGAAFTGLLCALGLDWRPAAVLGVGVALSSTAIVLPMLAERDQLTTSSGRDSFAVLLFQDLLSVPLIAIVPLLGQRTAAPGPWWPAMLEAFAAVAAILLVGRFLLRPLFRVVAGGKTNEMFTAAALLIVVGAGALVNIAGLPMALGTFAAGVILSESEYRHELRADIEPFEGLLLGFFFISIGMAANLSLVLVEPLTILAGVLALVGIKAIIGIGLERLRGESRIASLRFGLALAQGSEFGFVLFATALAAGVLTGPYLDAATLVVALSMGASPVLFALSEKFLVPRLKPKKKAAIDEKIVAPPAPVIILGFGRVGQIVGRVLNARKIPFNALDDDAENIETLRRYGAKAFYGDPTRIELLRAVGADEAKLLVVALGDVEQTMQVVRLAQAEFPQLRIYVRARDRHHAHLLMDLGVEAIVRETYFSSLKLSEQVLTGWGLSEAEANRTIKAFQKRDEQALIEQHDSYNDERQLIQTGAQAAAELRSLFEADEKAVAPEPAAPREAAKGERKSEVVK